jgi:hypothetical protein
MCGRALASKALRWCGSDSTTGRRWSTILAKTRGLDQRYCASSIPCDRRKAATTVALVGAKYAPDPLDLRHSVGVKSGADLRKMVLKPRLISATAVISEIAVTHLRYLGDSSRY